MPVLHLDREHKRYFEVKAWLDENVNESELWFALDDMPELYPEDAPVWVCDPTTGITDELCDQILEEGVPESIRRPHQLSWLSMLLKFTKTPSIK